MASLTDNAAVLIVANGLKYAVGFVLPMVFVRLMTRGDYGSYQQLMLLANVGTGLMLFGLPFSIYYFYRRSHAPTLLAQTQIMLLISSSVTAVAILLFAPELARHMHNPRLVALLPIFALYVGLNIFGELFMHVMISQGRYRLELGLEVLETAFRVTMLVSLLLLGYALHALVVALVLYAGLRLIGRSYWLWTGPDSVRLASWAARFPGKQLSYSLPLAASTCVGLIGGLLDKVIVALSFSPINYAIYSVGALEVPLDSIFQSSVANVLRAALPGLIAEGRLDEVVRIWRESVRKLALIMIPSFIFLTAFAYRLITTLFTMRYEASVPVFRIYLLALPLNMFILSAVPQVFGRTKLNLYVSALMVATNAALSLILLHFVGMLGPATAFACSSYVGSATYFVVTSRLLERRPLQLLPLPEMGRTALAGGIAVLAALGAASTTKGLVSLGIGGVVFAAAYLLAGYALRVFHPSDIATARSWIGRFLRRR